MGIIEKLRGELVDIIEWVDDSRHTLVWRFPRHHNQIKYGAQLIVRPGQKAVFVRGGKIADVFEPGQYRLETKNLPLLSTLAGWKYGFDSPFMAEVYFVSTRQVADLKWGTPNPVIMRDSDFGPVRVRAFGAYTLKATDPSQLLGELVGTDQEFEADEIHELLRAVINTAFADVIAKSEIPILELASHYGELSERVRQAAIERIDDEYGLEIPQLYIVNISVPAEVEQALDVRTSMNAIGDMASFQAYQIAQAMPVAAANPAGGVAGAGVGLGMGMALAGPMLARYGGSGSVPPDGSGAAGIAPPPPPPPTWYVAESGQTLGPFTVQGLGQILLQGGLRRETLVWTSGMAGWVPAGQVPEIGALFGAAPPPPPRPTPGSPEGTGA